MNERPPKRRHGFIGMVESSKAQPDEETSLPSPEPSNESRSAASILIKTVLDFNNGLQNLRRTNPELYKKFTDEQHAVADCSRRAGSNPDILDMRLD
jgi:hypothetical protein